MAKKIPIEISQIFRFRGLDAASFEAFCGFVAKIPIGISQVLRARGQDPDGNTSSFVAYIDFASFCDFIIKIILLMRQLLSFRAQHHGWDTSSSRLGYLKVLWLRYTDAGWDASSLVDSWAKPRVWDISSFMASWSRYRL